jgi:hypothetical protein
MGQPVQAEEAQRSPRILSRKVKMLYIQPGHHRRRLFEELAIATHQNCDLVFEDITPWSASDGSEKMAAQSALSFLRPHPFSIL